MRLFAEGHDVYVANLRGTFSARGHDTFDADDEDDLVNGAKAFWDFDTSDLASKDIPTLVNKILEERNSAGQDCKKVQLISYSDGAAQSLLTSAMYPTTSKNAIGSIQAISPCAVTSL